jgi:hypothetical protein
MFLFSVIFFNISCMNSPKTQAAVDQLSSLIQLVSSQMDPTKAVADQDKLDWLQSAMKGKKNLIQYLSVKVVMDDQKSKNEHRLSLLLLALMVRMASTLTSELQFQKTVLLDLTRVEGFWPRVLSLISSTGASTSIRLNALSLLCNAFRLNNLLSSLDQPDWPSLIFSESTIAGVVDLVDKHRLSGGFSVDSRLMLVCFEFFVFAFHTHPLRVKISLSTAHLGVVSGLLEIGGQLLLGGKDRVSLFGFDPIVAEIDLKFVRPLVNELIDIGGPKLYTPLALLCIDSTPVVSAVATPAKHIGN